MITYTVTQINRILKDLIDNELVLEDILVTGELSSFSITRNIAYFTLKDNDNLLSCVQFNCHQEFNVGDMVSVRGNIKYYPKGGKLTFNALKIELCGQGELYQQFLKLKERLEKEGLFDEIYKKPIPKFIKSIGVVTSKTGAVLQDIKNVTSRRNPNLDILVYDAQVQGKYAVRDVIEGITYFDNMTDVDVIIVARGGGSIEDLMPFNDEELARIAHICNKPLISAVGHETDFSILDFVADLRAPTPSAAAELVAFDNVEVKRYIKDIFATIQSNVNVKYSDTDMNIKVLISDIERNINSMINDQILSINDYLQSLDKKLTDKIDSSSFRVNLALNSLDKLNPSRLMMKGYSYITKGNDLITKDNTNIGDEISITTFDTKYKAKITDKEERC